nr:unnamed protein product [Digitaria exilis]
MDRGRGSPGTRGWKSRGWRPRPPRRRVGLDSGNWRLEPGIGSSGTVVAWCRVRPADWKLEMNPTDHHPAAGAYLDVDPFVGTPSPRSYRSRRLRLHVMGPARQPPSPGGRARVGEEEVVVWRVSENGKIVICTSDARCSSSNLLAEPRFRHDGEPHGTNWLDPFTA